jgi:arsenate reductase-like glutaredoxin family protein
VLVLELAPDIVERNYAKNPLTKAELDRILRVLPVADVLNTRHKVAKENGWKEKAPSKTAFVKAALEENNLLRRPVVIRGTDGVVGFDEDALRGLLA